MKLEKYIVPFEWRDKSVNLGGLLTGLNNNNRNDLGGLFRDRTLLIAIIVIIIIFGFGYGRGIFGGPVGGVYSGYRGFGAFGQIPPGSFENPFDRKERKHRKRSDARDGDQFAFAYGTNYGYYGYPAYPGFAGYGGYPGGFGGYPGYGGGFFNNDFWFIIAIIVLLFLLGEEREDNESGSINI